MPVLLPRAVSQQAALDILCGEVKRGVSIVFRHVSCDLNPGYSYTEADDSTFGKQGDKLGDDFQRRQYAFEQAEIEGLKQILSVYQTPMDLDMFKQWLTADIVNYAAEHGRSTDVALKAQQLRFNDELLSRYFSDALLRRVPSSSFHLNAWLKLSFIPNGVTIANGRIDPDTAGFNTLIQADIRGGVVPFDSSPLSSKIGKYSFPVQLLYLQKATENQRIAPFDLSPLEFYANLFSPFNQSRWSVWGELFAFPDPGSLRNVESWNAFLNFNIDNQVIPARAFLDSEQRPDAVPVTPSSVTVTARPGRNTQDGSPSPAFIDFEVSAQLGAIASESGKGDYVGFAGVELDGLMLRSNAGCSSGESYVGLTMAQRSRARVVYTAQIVVEGNGVVSTYESDIDFDADKSFRLELAFDQFQLSVRGKKSATVFDGKGAIRKLRVFVKRSLNEPKSTTAIPVQFEIFTSELTDCRSSN